MKIRNHSSSKAEVDSSRNLIFTMYQDQDDERSVQTSTPLPPPPIVYGELSILGYNGYIPNIERNGRQNRSKFLLHKRSAPNGIKKFRHYIVKQQPQSIRAVQDKDLHSISYTFSRSQTIIVEYRHDENTDMFQIGRSSEDPIDFVVMDTHAISKNSQNSNNINGIDAFNLSRLNRHEQRDQQLSLIRNNNIIVSSNSKRPHANQSTISRFACRILVDRQSPYTARIYAAGFDFSKNIFLGEKATKWEQNNTIDGLTTNGVLLMHPKSAGVWREVSVDGGIYAIRESRSAAQKGTRIDNESNILQDGTLIDLCGATLIWRSVEGFKASPTKKSLEEKLDLLNASRPQCPVGLNTLVIPRKPIIPANHQHNRKESSRERDKAGHQPYVYLKCGHVQGYHDWGATGKSNQRTCPICLSVGTVAKLSMGLEPSFYVDSGPLTHVFNPCGHMASEKTVKYWSSIRIPYGTHFFHSICPFCAIPLTTAEPQSTKLIFQDDLD